MENCSKVIALDLNSVSAKQKVLYLFEKKEENID
jgi:hypothetical protein